MPCSREKIQSLLLGDLSADQTHLLLDHIRDCEDCRKSMDLMVSTNPSNYPRTSGRKPEPAPRVITRAPRRGRGLSRRSLLFLGATTIIAVVVLKERGGAGSGESGDLGPFCRDALLSGQPFVISPQGFLSQRPRVVEVVFPLGIRSCRLRVKGSQGEAVEKSFKIGSELNVDQVQIVAAGDQIEALQVLIPFFDRKQLPLVSGESYELEVVPEPGTKSSVTSFRVSNP